MLLPRSTPTARLIILAIVVIIIVLFLGLTLILEARVTVVFLPPSFALPATCLAFAFPLLGSYRLEVTFLIAG